MKEKLLQGLEKHPEFNHYLIYIAIIAKRIVQENSAIEFSNLHEAFDLVDEFLEGNDTYDTRTHFGKIWHSLED